MRTSLHEQNRKRVMLGLLVALIVVLQIICTFIKFGPFSITLALTPIILGAAIYGARIGALLGFVFSLVVYITGLLGWDGGFVLAMMEYNAIGTTVLCLLKGTAAGFLSGFIYSILAKKKKDMAATTASILAPVINTGIFALGILTIFYGFLSSSATEGQSPVAILFLSWIGINFIVEFIVNVAMGTVLTRVIDYFEHNMKGKHTAKETKSFPAMIYNITTVIGALLSVVLLVFVVLFWFSYGAFFPGLIMLLLAVACAYASYVLFRLLIKSA